VEQGRGIEGIIIDKRIHMTIGCTTGAKQKAFQPLEYEEGEENETGRLRSFQLAEADDSGAAVGLN